MRWSAPAGGRETAGGQTLGWTTSPTSEHTSAWSCSTWPGAPADRVAWSTPVSPSGWPASWPTRGERWILVISHQPLTGSEGGGQILALLDRQPRVIAALSGHIHRNQILARPTPAGGYWLISTGFADRLPAAGPGNSRARHRRRGVAIQTWMLDHVFPGRLGTISRQLAYLDAQGGRPAGFAGGRLDRNVTLYRAAAGNEPDRDDPPRRAGRVVAWRGRSATGSRV